ncbi:MAG: hypothetical protein D6689_11745 [Deltaproteobacteria bacterium]|nr:MAG: hypothetical protein D6689_11745 [Deltaproteobacteria bacterium]
MARRPLRAAFAIPRRDVPVAGLMFVQRFAKAVTVCASLALTSWLANDIARTRYLSPARATCRS